MFLGSWKIDDLLTFYANTTRFDTGNATDADSPATYRIYEDETATPILTGTMALLDSANTAGFYSEQITLSAANGFEKGKSYAIYIAATVNSVAGATHHTLQIEAEVDANRLNWANVDNPSTAVNLSATNIDVDQVVASVSGAVGSVTGNVGGNVVGSVASVIAGVTLAASAVQAIWDALTSALTTVGSIGKLLVDNINATISSRASQSSVDTIDDFLDTEITTIITTLGTPAGVSISADIAAIEAQTDDIGTAGAGLTAIPWNAAWDAEVQSEVQDAIEANNLDHLAGTATGIPAIPAGTYIDQMMDDGTATYDRTTDSLQAIRDRGDAAWITATGFSTLTQADVRTAVGLASANLDTQLSAIATSLTTALARMGAFAGTGVNTVLGFFQALMRSDATTPSDLGGTYDDATDSLQALRDNVGTNGAALSLAKTTNITGFNDVSAAQVNAEVVDALNVDTYAEIGQESPAATQTIRKMVAYLYKAWRNRSTQTSTAYKLFADDATTVDQKATVSDDGTTFDRGEIGTGP